MKLTPWQAIAVYLVAVFLGAGLLAPVLYHAGHGWLVYPFARYVNRSLLIVALLLLWPLTRALGFVFWREVAVREPGWILPELGKGLALGLVSLGLVTGLQVGCGVRVWQGFGAWSFPWGAVVTAVLVAPLEELLFRGAIQTIFVRTWGMGRGIGIAALLFAVMHFIKVPSDFRPDPVAWWQGVEAVGRAFVPLLDWQQVVDKFLALVLVGLILGIYFQKTGRLWVPIGLHAGWIVALKGLGGLTQPVSGSGDLLTGPISLAVLAGFALFISVRWRR